MTTLTAPPESRAAAATPRSAARLRLLREGQAERVVETPTGKCSIGSSPRCQVCLPPGEAQPLQCLLQVEGSRATVTRWAAGALLNGREFSQEPLRDGDRLSIGPWELIWEAGPPTAVPAPISPPVQTNGARPDPYPYPDPGPAPALRPAPDTSATRETIDFEPRPAAPPTAAPDAAPPRIPPAQMAPPEREAPAPQRLTTPRRTTAIALSNESTAPPAADAAETAAPTPAVGSAIEPLAAAPAVAPRPAAKTVLVASRKTDAFLDLLGPARPVLTAAPGSKTTPVRAALTRQLFEDRLVVSLWTSNFVARRRARALIAAARESRQRVTELSATLAATQRQLDSLRTDSAADGARVEELAGQVEMLRNELAAAADQRDRVAAELEALRSAPTKTAPPDPRLQMLSDACDVAKREAAELNEQLAAAEADLAELRQRYEAAETAQAAAEQRADDQTSALASAEQRAAEQATAVAAAEKRASEHATALAAAQAALQELEAQSGDIQAERDAWQQQQLAAEQRQQLAAEQRQAASDQELETLRARLAEAELAIEPLRQQAADAEAARAEVADQLSKLQRQQEQWLAECRLLQSSHAEELASLTDERDELRRQLDELASAPAAAVVPLARSTAWLMADEPTAAAEPASEALATVADEPAEESSAWAVAAAAGDGETDAAREAENASADLWPVSTPDSATERDFGSEVAPDSAEVESAWHLTASEPNGSAEIVDATEPWRDPVEQAEHEEAPELPTTSEISTPVAPASMAARSESPAPAPTPYSTPSFIDKYRHLLEDEGTESAPAPAARRPNRLLDDEFLSPSQNSPNSSDDESDEALEAYMSNLMRRVRGDESSAAPAPVFETQATSPTAEAVEPRENAEPEIELDENGMLRLVRKQPKETNLSALREIANTSARTAIAHHRQRRHVESAVTKAVVCAAASAASAYLMLTAPSMQSGWFWGGCVTLVAAVGSGAQLTVIFWQRIAERKKLARGAASLPYGGQQAFDAEPAEQAAAL